jgi:RIO-like serine/threonine protein kinase
MTPNENLMAAAKLFEQRGAVYKDNYRRAGEIFMWLCPEGINVDSAEAYNRMAILMQIINKLLRYSLNWDKGHIDSIKDITVYTAILQELDEEYLNDAQ